MKIWIIFISLFLIFNFVSVANAIEQTIRITEDANSGFPFGSINGNVVIRTTTGKLLAVFEDNVNFNKNIMRSADEGSKWTSSHNISFSTEGTFYTELAILSNGKIFAFYDNGILHELRYVSSTNGGISWSSPITIVNTCGVPDCEQVVSAVGENNEIALAYKVNTAWFTITTFNSGTTWTTPIQVTPQANNGHLTVDKNNILHFVYQNTTSANNQIWYRNSTNFGQSWNNPLLIQSAFSLDDQQQPIIKSSKNQDLLVVCWVNSNSTVFCKSSTNRGASFSTNPINTGLGSFDGLNYYWLSSDQNGIYLGISDAVTQRILKTTNGITFTTFMNPTTDLSAWHIRDTMFPSFNNMKNEKFEILFNGIGRNQDNVFFGCLSNLADCLDISYCPLIDIQITNPAMLILVPFQFLINMMFCSPTLMIFIIILLVLLGAFLQFRSHK